MPTNEPISTRARVAWSLAFKTNHRIVKEPRNERLRVLSLFADEHGAGQGARHAVHAPPLGQRGSIAKKSTQCEAEHTSN
jgi:hypothetical protein